MDLLIFSGYLKMEELESRYYDMMLPSVGSMDVISDIDELERRYEKLYPNVGSMNKKKFDLLIRQLKRAEKHKRDMTVMDRRIADLENCMNVLESDIYTEEEFAEAMPIMGDMEREYEEYVGQRYVFTEECKQLLDEIEDIVRWNANYGHGIQTFNNNALKIIRKIKAGLY